MNKQNPNVIMRPAVAESIRSIKSGESVTFACSELASYSSACGVVSRLNSADPENPEYSIVSTDNGATYTITRRPKIQ